MLIDDGLEICKNSINIKFSKLFSDIYTDQNDIIKNKGKTGQMLEKLCGLDLSSNITDFEDGELKTIKMGKKSSNPKLSPKESSFQITMLNSWVDELLKEKILPFEKTRLHKKTKKFILMQVNKDDSDPLNWFFRKCVLYDGSKGSDLYKKLESDYIAISKELKKSLKDPSSVIHTTNGSNDSIIQIRTKGAGNDEDKSIYSDVLGREITNKRSVAFYMKRINFLKFNNENTNYE